MVYLYWKCSNGAKKFYFNQKLICEHDPYTLIANIGMGIFLLDQEFQYKLTHTHTQFNEILIYRKGLLYCLYVCVCVFATNTEPKMFYQQFEKICERNEWEKKMYVKHENHQQRQH